MMAQVSLGLILTPREHKVYLGGTPLTKPNTAEQWDTPEAILRDDLSIKLVNDERERLRQTTSLNLDAFFQLEGRAGITLPSLDERGITVSEPKIVEIDRETGKIIRELPEVEQERYLDFYREVIKDVPPPRIEGRSQAPKESRG